MSVNFLNIAIYLLWELESCISIFLRKTLRSSHSDSNTRSLPHLVNILTVSVGWVLSLPCSLLFSCYTLASTKSYNFILNGRKRSSIIWHGKSLRFYLGVFQLVFFPYTKLWSHLLWSHNDPDWRPFPAMPVGSMTTSTSSSRRTNLPICLRVYRFKPQLQEEIDLHLLAVCCFEECRPDRKARAARVYWVRNLYPYPKSAMLEAYGQRVDSPPVIQ